MRRGRRVHQVATRRRRYFGNRPTASFRLSMPPMCYPLQHLKGCGTGVSEPFLRSGDQGHKVGLAPSAFVRSTREKGPFGRPNPLGSDAPSIGRKIEDVNGHALQLGTRTDKTPSPIGEAPISADPPGGANPRGRENWRSRRNTATPHARMHLTVHDDDSYGTGVPVHFLPLRT